MKITSAYDMVQGDRDMNNEFKIYMIYFISDLMPCINSVAQSSPTVSDPMNCSLPGSSVHGIFQARVLEWGAIAFSIYTPTRLLYPPSNVLL